LVKLKIVPLEKRGFYSCWDRGSN